MVLKQRLTFLFGQTTGQLLKPRIIAHACSVALRDKKMPVTSENEVLNVKRQCLEGEGVAAMIVQKPPVLQFAKLSSHATAPTRGSKLAAGYDLYSAYDYTIEPKGKGLVKTDIQIAVPTGCYGRVAPRSGLTVKHFLDVGAGVIDEDYRGNVGVVLFNFGTEAFEVKQGMRVAQLILERISIADLEELPSLDTTERGEGGFGSSGTN